MINFKNASFVLSAPRKALRPKEDLKEVIFIGKSNVGKSSLINGIVKQKKLAFTSSKPGYTTLLNYYRIDNSFFLVDAPGYGYSKRGKKFDKEFGEMMEDYFHDNKDLQHVFFLLDSRHRPTSDDLDFYNFIKSTNIDFTVVMTKCDKLNQAEKAAVKKNIIAGLGELPSSMILVSSTSGSGINLLEAKIAEIIV